MCSGEPEQLHAGQARSFIVLWDFPKTTKNSLSTFYRRVNELLADYGGTAQCRATRSAYIVAPLPGDASRVGGAPCANGEGEGDEAMRLAYAIGMLAAFYGAGEVGEADGVVVLPLGDVSPGEHFESLTRARATVDKLCEDRRRRKRKTGATQKQIVERRD